jgi:outer membrane protein assembly factor BamE (lipoprotein component of BamABCDE complex)
MKKLGPPSFINPYDRKNVYYISQKMKKEIGDVNQFEEASFLEIFYNENDKVVEFNFKKENLPNSISLSKLNEKSIADDRTSFEVLRNILSNLRRNNQN